MEQLDTVISFRDGGSGVARELQRAASKGQAAKTERNLLQAFREISNICDSISLPKAISDIAKQLYKRADEEKILRGKSNDAIVACCIFIACRQAKVPRSFKEICQITRVPKKTIGHCFKALEQAFNLNSQNPQGAAAASALAQGPNVSGGTSAEDLLARYCNHLDLHPSVQAVCTDIVLAAREHSIAQGRSPISIAGGAIYFTSQLLGKPKTAKDISLVAGVSEGTVKLIYKLLYQDKEKVVKKELLESGKASFDRLPTVETK
jgi:transcription initiation factor TFIIB